MCDEASSNGYSNNKNVTAPRLVKSNFRNTVNL